MRRCKSAKLRGRAQRPKKGKMIYKYIKSGAAGRAHLSFVLVGFGAVSEKAQETAEGEEDKRQQRKQKAKACRHDQPQEKIWKISHTKLRLVAGG